MRLRVFLLTLFCLVLPPSVTSEAFAHPAQPPENAVYRLELSDGFCSGVVIAPTRMITARHCMPGVGNTDGPMSIALSDETVRARDPNSNVYLLKWLSYSDTDTAVLQLIPGQPMFPFGLVHSQRKPLFLDRVSAIGYGCDSLGTTFLARAKRPGLFGFSIGDPNQHLVGVLVHVCAGDSGGALVDSDGDLLGLLVSKGDDHRSAVVLLPEIQADPPAPNLFHN